MLRTFAALGAGFAFLAVAAGAFGAHALRDRLTPERLDTFEIAVRYQMYHAIALFLVAWLAERANGGPAGVAGWLFVVGILVFSATLYAIALGGPRWLGAITPIGGLCFLVGWLLLGIGALRA